MKLYNIKQAVITAVIFSISLMGLLPGAQAHDVKAFATDVHACLKKNSGNTSIINAFNGSHGLRGNPGRGMLCVP